MTLKPRSASDDIPLLRHEGHRVERTEIDLRIGFVEHVHDGGDLQRVDVSRREDDDVSGRDGGVHGLVSPLGLLQLGIVHPDRQYLLPVVCSAR